MNVRISRPHHPALGSRLPRITLFKKHHSKGLTESKTPGVLIPEDLRGLAKNQRVFPGLKWNKPSGYKMANLIKFPPMNLNFSKAQELGPNSSEPED